MPLRRILIIDDDDAVRTATADALARNGRDLRVAEDATAALHALDSWRPELVLCDVRMPDMDGLTLLDLLTERVPDADVIMMTAYDDMPTVIKAMQGGAVDFLVKPLDLHQLRQSVDRLLADRLTRQSAAAPEPSVSLDLLVGRDPRMIRVFKQIGQAAGVASTVLIRGASGTGKELVARAIHAHSAAASQPFVPVNCAALPETLLESELFGHVRGSFTGAHGDRRGRFALAGRGTIFLDEIGDTTLEFQTRLLRVLQDREFQPVGAETVQRTDARVITATHRPLETRIADGSFREDLYFRLRVLEIELPALRDRRSDIPLLARHLVARASAQLDLTTPVIADDTMRLLEAHDWPGNVRELEHTLTRAIVEARAGVIRPDHLVLGNGTNGAHGHGDEQLGTLDDAERAQVARVYAATGRNKLRTATILGVSRPRLDRLLEKHKLA
jgi:two-component system, NtrC family, response regulator AtoC